jgi:uncharacterized protein (TIGR03437 family)
MKVLRIAILLCTLAGISFAQVGNVLNAALYQPTNLEVLNGVVANGAVEVIEGFGFVSTIAPANIVAPRMLAVLTYAAPEIIASLGPFPPAASVAATLFLRPVGSNSVIPLTVTNAVSGAITFVVPSNFPLGGAELLYQIDNQPTQWTNVNVVQSSFEFFRISPGGPAIAQVPGEEGSSGDVGLATPAQPGQTLLLSGSGLGNGSTVSATIGGVTATVTYAGAYPALGLDEVLLQVPSGVPDGCYVPVTFTYNKTTVTTTISKTSDGSPCKHPWQLSVNDMKTLDSGGTLASGVVNLSSQLNAVTSTIASRNESANMSLSQISAGGIASYFTPAPAVSGPSCSTVTLGTAGSIPAVNGIFSVLQPIPALPDLGSTITLKSPTTSITLTGGEAPSGYYFSQNLPQPADGSLDNLPTSIPSGKWTWQSSSGKDLPASSFGFTLPAPIQLNGNAPISMRRDQDQTITWNGAAFDAGATVHINLSGTAALVTCTVPAGTGTVTIPAALLSGFAANTIGTLTVNLNESGSFLPHAQFQLQNGSTLLVVVSFSSNDSRAAAFQ